MSDKKNIDRLFQEKFKDFEVEPNEQVWINIDAALREKKKRRVIPIWFKLTGIAAGLILGFFAFNFLFDNSSPVENNQVVGNEKQSNEPNSIRSTENESVVSTGASTKKNNVDNTINPASINQKTDSGEGSASETNNAVANQTPSQKEKIHKVNSRIHSEENNTVANTPTQVKKTASKKKTIRTLNSSDRKNQEDAIVNNESKVKKNKKTSANIKGINSIAKSEDNNAVANSGSKSAANKKAPAKTNGKGYNSRSNPIENNAVAVENKDNSAQNTINKRPFSNEKKQNNFIAENEKTTDEQNSITKEDFPAIDVAKTDLIKKDSIAIAAAEPNALEELLKKNEEEKNTVAETKMNRWQITSNVAPIYFSSTSNGSPIDGQFAENSKSYENNLSFGVGVNYAVNKKISVRTGVNKFTLGYNTNDVVFFAAMDQQSFGSVASSHAGSTIQVVSQNNSQALRPFENGIQNTNEGIMTQRMGYFEVPVEMSYRLFDKKFGVNLIGGLSTLFLNENEVSVSSSTMSASLGRAKNLNDVHFSTNVGIGFKYRFWKSFEANFEPMFKYQINTFNKDAGNFKPYFIGLYSGVSFNF